MEVQVSEIYTSLLSKEEIVNLIVNEMHKSKGIIESDVEDVQVHYDYDNGGEEEPTGFSVQVSIRKI